MRRIKKVEEMEDIVKCKECNSRNLKTDSFRGELYCDDCGLVLPPDFEEKVEGLIGSYDVYTAEVI